MIDQFQSALTRAFAIVSVVLLATGALALSGFIAFDMMDLSGLLGYAVVALTAGVVMMAIALFLQD